MEAICLTEYIKRINTPVSDIILNRKIYAIPWSGKNFNTTQRYEIIYGQDS
jgi:hypothetical protein